MNRLELIRTKLIEAFDPLELNLEDESHLHSGHAGARDGRGHFALTLKSSVFNGKTRLQQHQLIYQALGSLMHSDIHALRIKVK